MAAACDLNVAKKNLQESLGDDMKIYLQNLKSWFNQKISKEDFDLEARRLLSDDAVHLHNEFLLAIIARCQTLSSSLVPKESSLLGKSSSESSKQAKLLKQKVRKRPPSSRNTFQQRFVPANPVMHVPEANFKGADDIVFAARELSLPDVTMVHGRMLVCAWESGLDDVSDTAVKLVMQSIENQLKNLISVVLSRRNGYKLREKKFKFAVGTQVKNPYLRHSNLFDDENTESEATMISQTGNHIPSRKPPVEIGQGAAAQQLAAASQPMYKGPVSLYDLLQSLQLCRSAIPSHSVYSVAMERVIHRLWHPGQEDINQDLIHRQEMALKQQMSSPASSAVFATGGHHFSLSSSHRTKHHDSHHGKHHHHHHHHHHNKSEHHTGHHKSSEHVKSENVASDHVKSEKKMIEDNKTDHSSSQPDIVLQLPVVQQKREHTTAVNVKSENILSPGPVKSEVQLQLDHQTGLHLKSEPAMLPGHYLAQQLTSGGYTNLKSEHSLPSHQTDSQSGQLRKSGQSLYQQMTAGQLVLSDDQMDFDEDNSLDHQVTSQLFTGHGLSRQSSLDQTLSDFFAGQFSGNS